VVALGGRVALGADAHSVPCVWSPTGSGCQQLVGHTALVGAVAFSSDGTYVATGGQDRTLRLWLADSGKMLAVAEAHPERVSHVAFRPDGRQIATAGGDHTVRLWDVPSLEPILVLHGHEARIDSLEYMA
jgi:WD40 repeat protein